MKAVNIEWDVDYAEDRVLLPTEIEIPNGMEDEDEISDYLSDVTGYCHKGYDLIEYDKDCPDKDVDTRTIEEVKTHRLNVTIVCQAVYNSGIDVPIDLSFKDALEYAKKHIDEIPLGSLDYVRGSDILDEENCNFDDLDLPEDVKNVTVQAKMSSLDQQIQSVSSRALESHFTDMEEKKTSVDSQVATKTDYMVQSIKFSDLLPGTIGKELDLFFEKNNWVLQSWKADKTQGYQVFFGEGVQVDNNYEYGFPYLFEKDELITFANNFYVGHICQQKPSLSDQIQSASVHVAETHHAEKAPIKDSISER